MDRQKKALQHLNGGEGFPIRMGLCKGMSVCLCVGGGGGGGYIQGLQKLERVK